MIYARLPRGTCAGIWQVLVCRARIVEPVPISRKGLTLPCIKVGMWVLLVLRHHKNRRLTSFVVRCGLG